jgi:hypothetical protein
MTPDQARYDQQAEQELRFAAEAHSLALRKAHLDKAAAFATLAELAGRGWQDDIGRDLVASAMPPPVGGGMESAINGSASPAAL